MSHLAVNAGLAARTIREHWQDDATLLALHTFRRLPAGTRTRLARLGQGMPTGSVHPAGILAALLGGRENEVDARLEAALPLAQSGKASVPRLCSWADLAMAAHRPELAQLFLECVPRAETPSSDRLAAGVSRLAWYRGELGEAVRGLEPQETPGTAGQLSRYRAEREVFHGWVPSLEPVRGYRAQPDRVLHLLTNSLPHTGSGYAQRSHSILASQRAQGWEVMAATRIGYPVQVGALLARHRDLVDGVDYRRILPRRLARTLDGRLQQEAEALLALARDFRPAVLHTTTHFVNGLVVGAVARALGVPWVYEVRGRLADTWASVREPEARESERYVRFQAREAEVMNGADLVITLGTELRAQVLQAGVPAARVMIAPNAVGEHFLDEPIPAATARRMLRLEEGLYLGTVSSLVPYEGLDTLVRSFARLASGHPRLRLLIVGDGSDRARLLDLAEQLGVSSRVHFPGRVPRDRARLFHAALDVFVVPRRDLPVTRAVTPLKPVEAMACARPVVASDLPALREIIQDGVTGLLVPPGDVGALAERLRILIDDAGLRASLGWAGRAEVLAKRTWTANSRRMIQAYRALEDGRGDTA
ncbi:glycosyltransferase family 4 protein [Arthrobacter sp. NPDC090010]|uniref:glycosyltransferase family 4 protein n=1 Tax=Arthrobacter sp. NPDC090010 TaxID=3363942 RepID=UPI0037FA20AF